jgi:hypothetical protein
VVGKPQAVVITSSPGWSRRPFRSGEVSAVTANKLAEEPELVSRQYFTPKNLVSFSSNSAAQWPAVSQNSSDASTRLINSCSS